METKLFRLRLLESYSDNKRPLRILEMPVKGTCDVKGPETLLIARNPTTALQLHTAIYKRVINLLHVSAYFGQLRRGDHQGKYNNGWR